MKIIFMFLAPALIAAAPDGDDPPGPALSRVEVFPPDVTLTTGRDLQSLVVQATYADGVTRDVTAEAQATLADPSLAKIEGGVLTPLKDGETQLSIAFGGQTLSIPVKIQKAGDDRPVSFRLDVMPVFAKAGCNTGTCHGAARGKDGFRLSLFGFDPAGDYVRLTREQPGRRLNLAAAHESLVVQKGLGGTNHTGGERFKQESELYRTLVRWLDAGAPDDPADVASFVSLEILPRRLVLEGPGDTHRLTVRARYSDGTDRDVTTLATFITNNESSAAVDPAGHVTAGQRGEAFVMARFDKATVGSQVIVVPKGVAFEWSNPPENNPIDAAVHAKLKNLRILPSGTCSDEAFLRRVTLDITGLMPTRAEFEAFTADTDPAKREKLVDRLLARKEFVELWVMKFAELLQIRSSGDLNRGISYKATVLYYNWLQEQIAANVPMNEIVQKLLSSKGGTFSSPATNFYQVERDREKLAENTAQVFMGMRIQCAQCHNHPFDRWTMDDYYGFVAFFSQVGRKGTEDPRETIIFNAGGGDVRHPVGGRTMAPKFLGGEAPDLKGRDRREVLAEWLASPQNPFFAKNLANIVWAHFMGRGIVEPVDDVRVSNPAANPELLEELGRRFTEYRYDFRKLVRDICTSRAYQRSTQSNPTNELDQANFSRGAIRRIRAEVMFDVISQVTETLNENKFRGLPQGARAVQIADGGVSTYFLTTFGRATRETVCSCEVKMEPNLSQALHLINGATVQQKIAAGGLVRRMLGEKKTPAEIVEELYVRCLTRRPSEPELKRLGPILEAAEDKTQVLEDLFWALLNSKEFMFNH
jgi:hypothetical protein